MNADPHVKQPPPSEKSTPNKQIDVRTWQTWTPDDVDAWLFTLGLEEDTRKLVRSARVRGVNLPCLTQWVLEYEIGVRHWGDRATILQHAKGLVAREHDAVV